MKETTEKVYAVLFQYSPNGRNDKGEFSSSVSGGRFFRTRDEACAHVKSKFDEKIEDERVQAEILDPDWAKTLSDGDFRELGYSWAPDFSKFGHELENIHPDAAPEPKYSWTVVELSCPAGE